MSHDNDQSAPLLTYQNEAKRSDVNNKNSSKTDLWMSFSCCLNEIKPVEQTFIITGWINFFWQDSNLPSNQKVEPGFQIEDDGHNIPLNMHAIFQNAVEFEVKHTTFAYNKQNSLVTQAIHFTAELAEKLELNQFPFDRQYMTIRLCVRTMDFNVLETPPSYVPHKYSLRSLASYYSNPSVFSSHITFSPVVGTCEAHSQSDDTRVTISLRVERRWQYWAWNIFLPSYIIGGLAPFALAMDPSEMGDRVNLVLTLLLTQVAFKFVVAGEIPKVAIVTLLDAYIIVGYLMMVVIIVICFGSKSAIDSKELQGLVNVWCFAGIEVAWLLLHMVVLLGANRNWFSVPWTDMHDYDTVTSETIMNAQKHDIHLADAEYVHVNDKAEES